jgi:hypothetical protein
MGIKLSDLIKAKKSDAAREPSEEARQAQRKATAEALEIARESLADGTNINPPEMAEALEATMGEIAGADETEDDAPVPGRGRKKTTTKRAGKSAVERARDVVETEGTDVAPVSHAKGPANALQILHDAERVLRQAAARCGLQAHVNYTSHEES